jgi:hypothetical protein
MKNNQGLLYLPHLCVQESTYHNDYFLSKFQTQRLRGTGRDH